MEVVYSIHSRLAGGGTGNTAYYAILGPERSGQLKRVLCSSNAARNIPAERVRTLGGLGRAIKRVAACDRSGRLNDWSDQLFDQWSSRVVEPSDVLHCWSDLQLTLRRGKELGATTILECMIHPQALMQILLSESERWGVRPADLQGADRFRRSLAEIDCADFIALPSQFNYRTHVEHGVAEKRLRVVPYGVDTQHFSPQPRVEAHPFRVLFVGHISIRKGVPYLLEAWQQLDWRDAELWLVGAQSIEMRTLLPRWQKLRNIRWLGYHSNTVDLYRQSDLFVFPSLGEGSALVTYEAMACGLPMVVSDNAGSLVRDTVDGLVIEPRDVSAIADALEQLRRNPGMRREMGCHARERIEPFTWQSYGERLLQVYHEVCRSA